MTEIHRCPRPQPEIVGTYKVVYPIWRDDMAEAVLVPDPDQKRGELYR